MLAKDRVRKAALFQQGVEKKSRDPDKRCTSVSAAEGDTGQTPLSSQHQTRAAVERCLKETLTASVFHSPLRIVSLGKCRDRTLKPVQITLLDCREEASSQNSTEFQQGGTQVNHTGSKQYAGYQKGPYRGKACMHDCIPEFFSRGVTSIGDSTCESPLTERSSICDSVFCRKGSVRHQGLTMM